MKNDRTVIAYVVHGFHTGGLERVVADLANRLDPSRYEPIVISLTESSAGSWLAPEIKVFSLAKSNGNSLSVIRNLAKILKKRRVDIVQSHNWPTLLETVLARKYAGVGQHIHTEHGTLPFYKGMPYLRRILRASLMRWGLKRADTVVSVAGRIVNDLEEQTKTARERVVVIPNGVDSKSPTAAGKEIRSALGIGANDCVFGSVGRLAPVKGFDRFIAAFALCHRQLVQSHLLLVGDGPELQKLKKLAAAMPCCSNIHFAGHQSEVGPWFHAMDVYVNSSHSEGLSISVLEAMAAGLPTLVTSVGDHESLVKSSPVCGVVVPSGDVAALAEGMAELGSQEEMRLEFGRLARKKQRTNYSLESMTTAYETLYSVTSTGENMVQMAGRA